MKWQRWPAAGADAWRCENVGMFRNGELWVVSAESPVSAWNAERTTIFVWRACPSKALEEMARVIGAAGVPLSDVEREALASLPWEGA